MSSAHAPTLRPQVLVVDDSSTVRTTVQIFLKEFADQIDLSFANDGFAAIRSVAQLHPALILADVLMPRLSGYQLCAMVKQNPATRNTPFYILSSKDGAVDEAIGRHCGADGHMRKPFSKTELTALVQRVLTLSRLSEPLAA